MIHSHELHDSPLNHSQTQPLLLTKTYFRQRTKLQERLHFKFVLRKKSKEVPSADNQRKIKDLIARFHSWNHLFMCDAAKACSRSAKKRTAWRSCDAQKQNGRRDSQPKLTKFNLNHSSSSCLPAFFTENTRYIAAKHHAKQHEKRSSTYKMRFLCPGLNSESSSDDFTRSNSLVDENEHNRDPFGKRKKWIDEW
jgi:hypothetical protein